jgi:hypothetical protein
VAIVSVTLRQYYVTSLAILAAVGMGRHWSVGCIDVMSNVAFVTSERVARWTSKKLECNAGLAVAATAPQSGEALSRSPWPDNWAWRPLAAARGGGSTTRVAKTSRKRFPKLKRTEIPVPIFLRLFMARADLSGCNLARQIAGDDLSNAALVKSSLDYADVTVASLVGINLGWASLIEAVLT